MTPQREQECLDSFGWCVLAIVVLHLVGSIANYFNP